MFALKRIKITVAPEDFQKLLGKVGTIDYYGVAVNDESGLYTGGVFVDGEDYFFLREFGMVGVNHEQLNEAEIPSNITLGED